MSFRFARGIALFQTYQKGIYIQSHLSVLQFGLYRINLNAVDCSHTNSTRCYCSHLPANIYGGYIGWELKQDNNKQQKKNHVFLTVTEVRTFKSFNALVWITVSIKRNNKFSSLKITVTLIFSCPMYYLRELRLFNGRYDLVNHHFKWTWRLDAKLKSNVS